MPDAAGRWDGKAFSLREFASDVAAAGSARGVDYSQTMSRITLRYTLGSQATPLAAQDLCVELSSWQLKVSAAGRPEPDESLAPLCGDLGGDVRRDLSWWVLEKEEQSGKIVFTIQLVKKEHKAWSTLWCTGVNPRRKQSFGLGGAQAGGQPTKKAEDVLVKVKPGRRTKPDNDRFVISRESLCRGYEEGQTESTIQLRIHFWPEQLEQARQSVPVGELFGTDVTDRCCKVFIRGDERSPMVMGELAKAVVPERTTWSIVRAKPPPDFDEEGQPMPRTPHGERPQECLQVTLVKASPSKRMWPEIMYQNEYANLRDAAPDQLASLAREPAREPSPDRSGWTPEDHARESKGNGDAAFKKGDWRDAIVHYTRAIGRSPKDEKLYSNRSACFVKQKKFDKALEDAKECISLNSSWPKGYFRQGQALRGLCRFADAVLAFREGKFRDASNPDWDKEVEKTEQERERWEEKTNAARRQKREADMTTELNEAATCAEQQAMLQVAEEAVKAGKSRQEAGKLALQGAEMAKQQVHEEAGRRRAAMMVEDGEEADASVPYRIVREDGTVHGKSLNLTSRGQYGMGMTAMASEQAPGDQPWIEIWHPGKLRWSQGCTQLRIKVPLPESVSSASEVTVKVTPTWLRIGTKGNADPIVEGEFERKVEPEGENFAWYLVPDERPPTLELCLDKATSEVYQTYSYTELIWLRLFSDDAHLGEGLFDADLTDLPPDLMHKYRAEQARANAKSEAERARRSKMTEEEISEEAARNWNSEFAKHGIPHRMATSEG